MITAKFRLDNKTTSEYNGGSNISLLLNPVTGGSEENDKFFASTPTGSLVFSVVRPEIAVDLEVGKEYYLDLRPAELVTPPAPQDQQSA